MIEAAFFARLLGGRPLAIAIVAIRRAIAGLTRLLVTVAVVHTAAPLIARRAWSAIVGPLLARRPLTLEWAILTFGPIKAPFGRALPLRTVVTPLGWSLSLRAIKTTLTVRSARAITPLEPAIERRALVEAALVRLAIRAIAPLKWRTIATLRRRGRALAIEAALLTRFARRLRSRLIRVEIALRTEAALAALLHRWLPRSAWRTARALSARSGGVVASSRRHLSSLLGWTRTAFAALGAFPFRRDLAIPATSGILFRQFHMHRFEE